ncbi:hypothetical protein R3P38DRAFT_3153563 [Favolaschia claudopus]|uniref:MYND-type domain-containing protein n=1 Tax=Favolaschia claudopus TaxID=2862362 RepID=A0AAV9Z007_9AGAR
MHPSLHRRNLNGLPPEIRIVANAAVSASRKCEHLQRLYAFAFDAPDSQRILLLPVAYFNLDPREIPGPDSFEAEPSLLAVALNPCWRAFVSIAIIDTVPHPEDVLFPPTFYTSMLAMLCALGQNDEMLALIVAEPWVWHIVGQAWRRLPNMNDIEKRQSLIHQLAQFFPHRKGIPNSENLARLLDGVGGTLSDLARSTVSFFHEVVPVSDRAMTMPEIEGLESIIALVTYTDWTLMGGFPNDDPIKSSPFTRLLPSHKVIPILLRAANLLSKSIHSAAPVVLRECFGVLHCLLISPFGLRHLPAALKAGLLHTLITCAMCPFARELQMTSLDNANPFKQYLFDWIPPFLINYSVLSALDVTLNSVIELADCDAFKASRVHPIWEAFIVVAQERLKVLHAFRARPSSSDLKACDNLECLKIENKNKFQRCSACCSLYYCSAACQKTDWCAGHRAVCSSYGSMMLSERNSNAFTTRERSFLRALLDHDYQKHRTPILFDQRGRGQNHGESRFFNVVNRRARGPEWNDILHRAAMVSGRIKIDVVKTQNPTGAQYLVVPLRANTSTIQEELSRVAEYIQFRVASMESQDTNLILFERLITVADRSSIVEFH